MKKWWKKHFQRYMLRPIVYQTFTRVVFGLTGALLWNELVNISQVRLGLSRPLLVVGIFYAVMAWMAYLRLDGISAPKFDRKLFQRKRTPMRAYGDMIDYVDEPVVTYAELEPEEKDTCLLVSNLICTVVFVGGSFFF